MQEMLAMAEDFQNRNLPKFNMEKSQCIRMNFDRRKSKVIEQPLKLNSKHNKKRAVVNEIKFLINQAPFKTRSMEICIKLIECILTPKVLYGCETWSKIPKKK